MALENSRGDKLAQSLCSGVAGCQEGLAKSSKSSPSMAADAYGVPFPSSNWVNCDEMNGFKKDDSSSPKRLSL